MAEGFKFRIFYPIRSAKDIVPLHDVTKLSTTEISVCASIFKHFSRYHFFLGEISIPGAVVTDYSVTFQME
jgi:hypothetical protein